MPTPKADDTRWIALTDNRWGRLVRFQLTKEGRWHAEEVATVRSEWEEHQDRFDQSGQSNAVAKANAPDHAAHGHSWGHKKEEETKRFAHEIAAWLDRQSAELKIQHLAVFAPDHFLGPLRASWSKRLLPLLTEHAADLTHLKPALLGEHPTVAKILAAPQAS
jgi:protein required for attachment to host cells